MRLRLVTVGAGAAWEADLVRACQAGEVAAEVLQRCYDLGDLLAAAAGGRAEVAIVAGELRWMDRDALSRLATTGLRVVGVVPTASEDTERRLRQLGLQQLGHASDPPAMLVKLARAAVTTEAAPAAAPQTGTGTRTRSGSPSEGALVHNPLPFGEAGEAETLPVPAPSLSAAPPEVAADDAGAGAGAGDPGAVEAGVDAAPADLADPSDPSGRFGSGFELDAAHAQRGIIVVWGPKGAPGRTTIAVNLAFESVPLAGETLLVDADTYGGTIAQALGFLEDYPGLAWAARLASRGELDSLRLWQAARRAGADGPRVLAGLPRAELWTEVRPSTWEALLDLFQVAFPLTIVDVGFCLEEDEELLYDQVRLRRNAVTRLALQRADLVVAVARADPVGLHDFIRGYQQLRELDVPAERVSVVVNQVRGGSFGGDQPAEQIRAALRRYTGIDPAAMIPYDRAGMDAALMAGQALCEARASSAARQALLTLAASILDPPATTRRQQTRRRRLLRRAGRGRVGAAESSVTPPGPPGVTPNAPPMT